jgi:hypothetical protein
MMAQAAEADDASNLLLPLGEGGRRTGYRWLDEGRQCDSANYYLV